MRARSHGSDLEDEACAGNGGRQVEDQGRAVVDEGGDRDDAAVRERDEPPGDPIIRVRAVVEDDLGDGDGGREGELERRVDTAGVACPFLVGIPTGSGVAADQSIDCLV